MIHNTHKHTLHTKPINTFIAFPCYLGRTLTWSMQYWQQYRYCHNEDDEDDAEDAEDRYKNNTTNVNIIPADYLHRDEETHIDIRNVMNEARYKVLDSVDIAAITDKVKTQDLPELRYVNIAVLNKDSTRPTTIKRPVTGKKFRIV